MKALRAVRPALVRTPLRAVRRALASVVVFFKFLHNVGHVVHILPTLGSLLGLLFQPWGYFLDPLAACFAITNGAVALKVSQERPKAATPVSESFSGDNFGYVF